MLRIEVPLTPEGWDEEKEEFVTGKVQVLQLEHSLVSISKWESKWCKPFLTKNPLSDEETLDYIKCMTLTQNVNPDVYNHLSQENVDDIMKYINAPMTATTVSEDKNAKPNREIITAEVIYYWMIACQIPSEYRKWHLNKLLMLIRVCTVKNSASKPKSKREIMSQNAALNAARKKKLNTRG